MVFGKGTTKTDYQTPNYPYKREIPFGDIWEWYYENGKIRSRGSYLNGSEDGVWKYYFEDGSLHTTETY